MNTRRLGYVALAGLALLAPACGGDSDDGGGTGGSAGTSTSKGGSSSGGTSSAGKGGSSSSSGGTGTGKAGSSSAGSGSSGDGGSGGSGASSSSGGSGAAPNDECSWDSFTPPGVDTGEAPEGCEAYVACVNDCNAAVFGCYEEGAGCHPFAECYIEDCECDDACIEEECVSELAGDCISCQQTSATCLLGCLDDLMSCL